MEEIDILKIIAENPEISQRKIAKEAGISLGQVNFLIKKCAKKGLIKIEGQTPKSIKYNLTPKGIAEKTALTLEYIRASLNAVNKLADKIIAISEGYELEKKQIIVCGPRDEIFGIFKLALGNKAIYISDLEDIPLNAESVYFCWEENIISSLKSKGMITMNILS